MGEQSNAYRILLRYDRKSRHRRIKKQRRYERLAATSQFRTTRLFSKRTSPLLRQSAIRLSKRAPSRVGVARTLGRFLRRPTPYRALNTSAFEGEGAESAADCLYSTDFYPDTPRCPLRTETVALRLVPPTYKIFPHPGVSPKGSLAARSRTRQRRSSPLSLYLSSTNGQSDLTIILHVFFTTRMMDGLDPAGHGTWDYDELIPVVTFLAPLASNFEGLKDR